MKNFRYISVGFVLCTLLACGSGSVSTSGSSSSSSSSIFTVQGSRAFMRGELGAGTGDQLRALMRDHPQVTTIVMVDVPGSNDDDAAIAAYPLVRQFGLSTIVPSNGVIASGGVDFFIAGTTRTIEPGGMVGVHAWSDGSRSAASFPANDPAHRLFIDYYQSMGLPDPEGFYFFTINAAPPEGIHYMSANEIARYGLTN